MPRRGGSKKIEVRIKEEWGYRQGVREGLPKKKIWEQRLDDGDGSRETDILRKCSRKRNLKCKIPEVAKSTCGDDGRMASREWEPAGARGGWDK